MTLIRNGRLTHNQVVAGSSPAGPRGAVPKTFENQSAFGVLYFLYPSRSLKRASFAYGHKKKPA